MRNTGAATKREAVVTAITEYNRRRAMERLVAEARLLARASRERGLSTPSTDPLIAACARAHGLEILHCDVHFERLRVLDPTADSQG